LKQADFDQSCLSTSMLWWIIGDCKNQAFMGAGKVEADMGLY